MTTYKQILTGVWNDLNDRFEPVKDCEVSIDALLSVAQLALVGWTFCGADEKYIQLERTTEEPEFGDFTHDLVSIDRISGHVICED